MVNMVIAGDYKGAGIAMGFNSLTICKGFKRIKLTKDIVESYEVMTEEHRKSAKSGVARGLIGGALLGGVGTIAGAVSAKNKGTYQVAVYFKDGKKSLLQLDDKAYKILIKTLF
ncbi:MAG: hypothetical protein ACFWTN_07660 [Clostridium sp.]|jgi:hypothetical protein